MIPRGRPLVLFTRPEHAKEIFAGDPEVFHAGKGNAILGPIMGEHSLLLQDSAEHKRARKLLMPAFNGHALREYESLVTERGPAPRSRPGAHGSDFRSLDRMNALTLEVILRVVFGVTDERRLAELRPRVNRTVDVSPAILLGWGWPWLQRFGPWKRTVENQHELDRLMYAEIRERRAGARPGRAHRRALPADPDGRRRRRRSPTPSSATSSSPCCSPGTRPPRPRWPGRSTRSAATREQLRAGPRAAAADEGDDAWLEAVLKESMRLHPVIPMVVRTLMKPATIGGIDLPAGATVGPSILIAHAREDNHPDPERFRPERFLGHNPPTNTWIPFGGGVRRCIGAGLLADGGRGRAARGVRGVRRHRGRRRRAEGPQHHQRPAGRSPDPGAPTALNRTSA